MVCVSTLYFVSVLLKTSNAQRHFNNKKSSVLKSSCISSNRRRDWTALDQPKPRGWVPRNADTGKFSRKWSRLVPSIRTRSALRHTPAWTAASERSQGVANSTWSLLFVNTTQGWLSQWLGTRACNVCEHCFHRKILTPRTLTRSGVKVERAPPADSPGSHPDLVFEPRANGTAQVVPISKHTVLYWPTSVMLVTRGRALRSRSDLFTQSTNTAGRSKEIRKLVAEGKGRRSGGPLKVAGRGYSVTTFNSLCTSPHQAVPVQAPRPTTTTPRRDAPRRAPPRTWTIKHGKTRSNTT